ncbi:ribonuclease HI family protein [Latilactobacillus curvatus]|uniref:ribonuclease HI family protein n=1 Tax=Latilactobacillus curvatus TaxID=28038 RepID=UPI0020C7CDA3|nr:ribonuclease HI family protein [Latilactobacillus curvatus]MCP8848252.1 ribonuclease HI family protein [Latilactobacillus curvatus]MCP8850553.1 ribonuclease HI family protein [Latilactobacillus curvatus]MCP8864225.1 ribonuclease HI family protein [Latilactobacillus curvatus]MCP8873024.1 ribonuclease HI family protein [Latilactobacillus curvatus]MCP8874817.1 ribonuclease HI family protein [Latilactobacillus curvatus]
MIKLYTDAATRGNPGPSAAGILIVTPERQYQLQAPLPEQSNHDAEFSAVILGLEQLANRGLTTKILQINVDSKLVFQSLEKRYAKHYQAAVDRILALEAPYSMVIHQWIPERQNQGAHHLAQQGLPHLTDC